MPEVDPCSGIKSIRIRIYARDSREGIAGAGVMSYNKCLLGTLDGRHILKIISVLPKTRSVDVCRLNQIHSLAVASVPLSLVPRRTADLEYV